MSNRDVIKSYTAEGAILPCRFVKPGANDYGMAQAAAVADKIIGVSMPLITVGAGDTVDIMHDGIADLQIGATLRMLLNLGDLRPLLRGSSGERIARNLFAEYPGEIPAGAFPAGWVPEI